MADALDRLTEDPRVGRDPNGYAGIAWAIGGKHDHRERHSFHPRDGGGPMHVLMTGATGVIGSALSALLRSGGHTVRGLARRPTSEPNTTWWNPGDGTFAEGAFDGIDAVVHLAGESIASGRWTAARKARIRDSRVEDTRKLAEALSGRPSPPRVFISASAIGFYGDRGDQTLDESASAGQGFLPEVCAAWEAAADPLRAHGVRVVHLRFGIILSATGGALPQMLLPFKLGVGGVLGPGTQYMSWIALDDVLGASLHALANESVAGPVNLVAPQAVTNREFTKVLGRVLQRPTIFPAPAFALRLLLGEMAEALLLASARVEPGVLTKTGYEFAYTDLAAALRHVLGRSA